MQLGSHKFSCNLKICKNWNLSILKSRIFLEIWAHCERVNNRFLPRFLEILWLQFTGSGPGPTLGCFKKVGCGKARFYLCTSKEVQKLKDHFVVRGALLNMFPEQSAEGSVEGCGPVGVHVSRECKTVMETVQKQIT